MNIDDVLYSIENLPNKKDRVISLVELMLFIRDAKQTINFPQFELDWKNKVAHDISTAGRKEADKLLARTRDLLDFYLNELT